MAYNYETLDGYIVVAVTLKALGIRKKTADIGSPLAWVPRSCVEDGEAHGVGEEDLSVAGFIIEREGFDT